MKVQQFDDRLLNSAWQEVELEFRTVGEIAPAPGFTNRWKERLAVRKQAEQRRQAWLLVGINAGAALALLVMMGLLRFPGGTELSEVFVVVVRSISEVFVFFKMAFGVFASLARTMTGLVPLSWWTSIVATLGALCMLWLSMMRQIVQRQGVQL